MNNERVALAILVVILLGGLAYAGLSSRKRDPRGEVLLGDPTVTGLPAFGGDMYWAVKEPRYADDETMNELIKRSNAAIEADDAE